VPCRTVESGLTADHLRATATHREDPRNHRGEVIKVINQLPVETPVTTITLAK